MSKRMCNCVCVGVYVCVYAREGDVGEGDEEGEEEKEGGKEREILREMVSQDSKPGPSNANSALQHKSYFRQPCFPPSSLTHIPCPTNATYS